MALFALTRLGIGLAFALAPSPFLRIWTGGAATPAAGLAARSLGAREIALATGTLTSLGRGAPLGDWLTAAVVSDAADALNTIFSRHVPGPRRVLWTASAAWAAVMGLKLKDRLR